MDYERFFLNLLIALVLSVSANNFFMKRHITIEQGANKEDIASIFWDKQDLESVEIHKSSAASLPRLPRTLTELQIYSCPNLVYIPPLPDTLAFLFIFNCPGLDSLPDFPSNLMSLYIEKCPGLKSLPELCVPLNSLSIHECKGLTQWPSIPDSVTRFSVASCPGFTNAVLPSKLEYLRVDDCPQEVDLRVGRVQISICPKGRYS